MFCSMSSSDSAGAHWCVSGALWWINTHPTISCSHALYILPVRFENSCCVVLWSASYTCLLRSSCRCISAVLFVLCVGSFKMAACILSTLPCFSPARGAGRRRLDSFVVCVCGCVCALCTRCLTWCSVSISGSLTLLMLLLLHPAEPGLSQTQIGIGSLIGPLVLCSPSASSTEKSPDWSDEDSGANPFSTNGEGNPFEAEAPASPEISVPVRALYDYEGQEQDELSFKAGGGGVNSRNAWKRLPQQPYP